MEPFKNIYNRQSIKSLAQSFYVHYPQFNKERFVKASLKGISKLEMKQRVVQISESLKKELSDDFPKNSKVLIKVCKSQKDFILWPISYFVEQYGIDHFKESMQVFYTLTQKFTAEFGIRPFIKKYPNQVYDIFQKWAINPDVHIRRLVSEGTRPNLPWGMKVPLDLKQNIKLLELLKDDPEEYVQKSVANHMNDLTRVDDQLALKTLKKWKYGKNKGPKRDWIIKHALRSLFKMGHPQALELMGYNPKVKFEIRNFKLSAISILEGESIDLSFSLKSKEKKITPVMIDYIIYYPKKNGELAPKTFKLKICELKIDEKISIKKMIPFKKVTTRKHYPGKHFVSLLINGQKVGKKAFILKI